MGLDASVMCNCYGEGRTTEAPVPRDWLYLDEGGYLGLRPEHETNELIFQVDEWQQTCCEHPGMDYASERIANWAGYRLFQEALEASGWEYFPVLQRNLPEVNGGLMLAADAAMARQELDRFRNLEGIGSNAYLLNTATGEMVFQHVAAYDGIFYLGGSSGMDIGIGQFEFFIRDRTTNADVFRATRFRQTVLERGPDDELVSVEFLDLDTGMRFVCSAAIAGQEIPWPDGRMKNDQGRSRYDYPTEFHVEVRKVRPADFSYILDPLEKIFRAAVETGNPVRWS